MLRSHVADAGGVFAQGMRAQNFKDAAGGFGRDEKNHLALIRHVHRIETEQLAGGLHFGAHREAGLVDSDANIGGVRNLV